MPEEDSVPGRPFDHRLSASNGAVPLVGPIQSHLPFQPLRFRSATPSPSQSAGLDPPPPVAPSHPSGVPFWFRSAQNEKLLPVGFTQYV